MKLGDLKIGVRLGLLGAFFFVALAIVATGGWRALMRRQRCFATEPSAGGFYVEGYAEGLFAMSDRTAELQRYRKKRRDISGDALS